MRIAFDNTYARELAGAYVAWQPAVVPSPQWLYLNRALAAQLGLDGAALATAEGAALFAGNNPLITKLMWCSTTCGSASSGDPFHRHGG